MEAKLGRARKKATKGRLECISDVILPVPGGEYLFDREPAFGLGDAERIASSCWMAVMDAQHIASLV